MVVEAGDQRLQFFEKFLATFHRERADHPDRVELAISGVETQQQRADPVVSAGVGAIAGDHAVGGALVLDLHHLALGLFGPLLDGGRDFLRLAEAEPYAAVAVAHDHQRGEAEALTALDDLGDAADVDDALDQL